MRHKCSRRALGMGGSRRSLMLRSLTTAVLLEGRVLTTEVRAKEVRRFVERVVTLAKRAGQNTGVRWGVLRRWVDKEEVVLKLADYVNRYSERGGGYTRLLRYGVRMGDNSHMVVLEMVE